MWKDFNPLSWLVSKFGQPQDYRKRTVMIQETAYLLRPIEVRDIKQLLSIEREVYEGELPWTRTAFLAELSASSPHLYLGAQKGRQLVGFVGCRIFQNEAHVTNIAVLTSEQGLGIGTLFLSEIKVFAKRHQCRTLSLEVRISNQNAQRLYRKFGFQSVAVKKNYYTNDQEDALEMRLRI